MDFDIASILGGSLGKTVESLGTVVKKFVTTDNDRMDAQKELEVILQKRDSEIEQTIRAELTAKSSIIKAEMAQGDNYTKRARPSVVYYGLGAITIDLIIRCIMLFKGSSDIPLTMLPDQFWWAWGGIVSTWVVGRSAEKRGMRNKVTDFITGAK